MISKADAGAADPLGKRDRAGSVLNALLNAVLDARGPRTLVCVLAAVAIWIGFSVGFVRGLWNRGDVAPVTKPAALDVRLVRLPPPELPHEPRPTPQAGQLPQSSQQANTRTVEAAAPAAQTKPARTTRRSVEPTRTASTQTRDVSRPAAAPVATPPIVEGNERARPVIAPPTPPVPETANATSPATASATTSAHANAPQPNGPATPAKSANAANATNATTEGSSTSAGNGPAHAILQPLPSLPDDLREDAFQAVATARFSVHPDGSVDVALIKPTHNPRLNQLLLDALKKWRFFPAMKNGEAVESTQDIRVHFNID
ncbi:energy transducer TonB [Paraburkholderia sp. 2C]